MYRRHPLNITHHARLALAQVRRVLLLALVLALCGSATALPAAASSSTTDHHRIRRERSSRPSRARSGRFSWWIRGSSRATRSTPSTGTPSSDCTTTVVVVRKIPLSCAGPESDKSADWPASHHGREARRRTRSQQAPPRGGQPQGHRRGQQVTYAGKLLYLFDMAPHQFSGENFVETVLPLPPWHGYWYLVSANDGTPATGPAASRPRRSQWSHRPGCRHVPGYGCHADRRLHLQQGHEGSQCVHGDLCPDLAARPDDRTPQATGLASKLARRNRPDGRHPGSSPSTVSRCTSTPRRSRS